MRTVSRQGMRLRTHVVVGELDAVRRALHRAYEQGRLVELRQPAQLPDGRVRVTAQLWEPLPARTRRPRALRRWLIGAGALAALAVGAGVVWLLVLAVLALIALVTAVVGWVSAHLVVILVALALLLVVCGGGGCAGIHCGGCRR